MDILLAVLAGLLGGVIGAVIIDKIRHRKSAQVADQEFVSFRNATRAGQHVIGNMPGVSATFAPNINNGGKFIGTIKHFPAKSTTDIIFMDKLF